MNLGDTINLKIEYKPTFKDGEATIKEGDFVVIGISKGMPHCFGDDSWSGGFSSFEYGDYEEGRPDVVRRGSVYVPSARYLDYKVMDNLNYDKKIVSWKVK